MNEDMTAGTETNDGVVWPQSASMTSLRHLDIGVTVTIAKAAITDDNLLKIATTIPFMFEGIMNVLTIIK